MRMRASRCFAAAATCAAAAAIAVPAPAAALSAAGGGEAALIVNFAAPGVPQLPGLCSSVSFSFYGGSQVAAITLPSTLTYIGPVSLSGSGSSICSGVPFDSGNLSLTASGTSGVTGTVNCSFSGPYFRFGPAVLAQFQGPCTLDGTSEPSTGFVVTGLFRPSQGNGVTSPISQALFNGAFALQG